jgi:hypothetical protein
MAKVVIENAEVVKHLSTKGFIAQTRYKLKNGEEKTDKWTVWGEQPPIGSVVNIDGLLSVKLEDFQGDEGTVRYARGHINNAQIVQSAQPTSQGQFSAPAASEQVPF